MSHSEQITQIWTQAIIRYEQITGKRLDVASLRRLTTVGELLEAVESENRSFTDFRTQRGRMFSALEKVMLPIQVVGDLASTGAQVAFPPAGLIFSAAKHLITAAGGVSAKYDAIVELMGTLKDFTVRLGIYSQQQISDLLQDKLTDILTTMLEVFAIARHQIERGRLHSFGRNVLLGSDEGKAIIDKLRHLMDSERGLITAEIHTGIQAANTAITRVDSSIARIALQMNEMGLSQMQTEQAQEKRNRNHLKQVLQPTTSANDRYSSINRSRTQGTGDWIREEKMFRDWVNGVRPLLWVTGTPGAGKTYLASSIIGYLQRQFPQNVQHPSHVSVAYFFFKDDDWKTRSLHQALRDTALQTAQNDPMYLKHVVSCVDTQEDIATLVSLWQRLYVDFFLKNDALDSRVYIILDALDEAFAEDRHILFQFLQDIQQGGRIQFLILGRPHIEEEITEIVEILAAPTIYVSDLNNSDDIVRYIKSSVSKSVYLRRASKALQSEIVDRLSAGARGMFIWVDFMLKELLKKRDEGSMRKALDEAPNGLSQMIRHVLRDISERLKGAPQYAEDLNEMLAWATCATSPLTLHEMENVIKWRSESGDGWIWLEGDLRRQYASFFALNRKDGLTTAELQRRATYLGQMNLHDSETGYEDLDNMPDFNSDPKTTYVTLMHASLGDFFRNEQNTLISADGCPPIGVSFQKAKVRLFKRCYEIISCPEDSRRRDLAQDLLLRASGSVIPILEAIEIQQCSKADKQAIGLYVAKLLSDEWAMPRFVMFTGKMYKPEEVRELFMTWLSDCDVQEALPPGEKAWYDSFASVNHNDVFIPMIRYIARSWLENDILTSHADHICQFIHGYLYVRGTIPERYIESAEVVMTTAEWCDLEKNTFWYRRLAIAMRNLGFVGECIEYFEKAMKTDSLVDEWLARAEMAVAFISKKDYMKAIEIQEVCLQKLEKSEQLLGQDIHPSNTQIHRVLESLGFCYNKLGNFEKGLSFYRKALGYDNNRCNKCVRDILAYLDLKGEYTESMNLLREMGEQNILETDCTRLSECLILNADFSDAFSHWFSAAAYRTATTDYMIDAYASAAMVAFSKGQTVEAANLELCRGVFLHRYGHDAAGAARIWERLINTYRGNRSEGEMVAVLEAVSRILATHYLTQAMEAGVDSAEGQRYGEMLQLLAQGKALHLSDVSNPKEPERKNGMQADQFVTNSEVGLIMGNYYQVFGRKSEAIACYRAQVRECIRLLSDNDPSNDGMAFRRLAGVLAGAGDTEGAAFMWHQSYSLMRYDSEGMEQSIICKGCHKSVEISEISICRYCHNVILCATCLQLRRSGSLAVNICSQQHDWIALPPLAQNLRERSEAEKDMVFLDDHWIKLGEFKRQLMAKWEIK